MVADLHINKFMSLYMYCYVSSTGTASLKVVQMRSDAPFPQWVRHDSMSKNHQLPITDTAVFCLTLSKHEFLCLGGHW